MLKLAHLPAGARRDSAAPGARLPDLRAGQKARVRSVGPGPLRRRLMELGFVSGTPVRVVRYAPFGGPMEVELHGYHVSLRRSEAVAILVDA